MMEICNYKVDGGRTVESGAEEVAKERQKRQRKGTKEKMRKRIQPACNMLTLCFTVPIYPSIFIPYISHSILSILSAKALPFEWLWPMG